MLSRELADMANRSGYRAASTMGRLLRRHPEQVSPSAQSYVYVAVP